MTTTDAHALASVSLCSMSRTDKKKAMSVLPRRQMVLLACDIARTVLPVWDRYDTKDKRPLKAIQAGEKWVTITAVAADAAAADAAAYAADAAAAAAAYAAAATAAAATAYAAAAYTAAPEKIDRLYRQAVREVAIPSSRDTDNLARLIMTGRQFELGPILADALEDVGFHCDESLLELHSGDFGLSHCVVWNLFARGE